MSKNLILIYLSIFSMLAISGVLAIDSNNYGFPNNKNPGISIYNNLGMTFEYPSDWQISGENGSSHEGIINITDDQFNPIVDMQIMWEQSNADPRNYDRDAQSTLNTSLPAGLNFNYISPIYVDGNKAYGKSGIVTGEKGVFKMVFLSFISKKSAKQFVIAFAKKSDDKDDAALNNLDHLLKTWHETSSVQSTNSSKFGFSSPGSPSLGESSSRSKVALSATNNSAQSITNWICKGNILYHQNKYNEAIQAYNEAIKIDPQNASAWNFKGYALDRQRKYDEAIKAYDRAIEINPQYVNASIHKGIILYHQNKYDEAIQAYDEAIKIDPQNASAWNFKGYALDHQGKHDEAIKAYERAIEIDPRFENAWYKKGAALYEQGKYNEAIQAYDEAIKIDPQNASYLWNNKGAALYEQGKYNEAIQAYDEAIKIDPQNARSQNAESWNGKGNALCGLGRYDEAVQCYNTAIEINQDAFFSYEKLELANSWNGKGNALKALGRTADADGAFAKAKEASLNA